MKFFSAIIAGAAAVSALSARDYAAINSAISQISSDAKGLASSVSSFSGAAQVGSLQEATQKLIDDIKAGAANAGTTPLTTSQAANLAGPIQDLGDTSSSAINGVIAKKPAFDKLGVSSVVYDELVQIKDAATAFSNAVIKLVPADLQATAQSLSQPLIASIQKGVDAYKGSASSGGSGASSGSGSTATSAAPTSTAAGTAPETSAAETSAPAVVTSSNATVSTPSPTAPVAAGAGRNMAALAVAAVAVVAAI